jgi:hypothetical protein
MKKMIQLSVLALLAMPVLAGAKVKINDVAKFDIGFRLQTLYINTDKDLDGDGNVESYDYFKVRRGRLRMKMQVGKKFDAFIQTELGSFGTDGTGGDWRVIDSWIRYKFNKDFSVYVGQNMAPTSREALTSSGGLFAIDRNATVYKDLTWGTRAVYAFNNITFKPTDAKLRSGTAVRDAGITLFFSKSASENLHYKLYAAVNNGIQASGSDKERMTFRGQINFFNKESGYFNSSSYLGKKKTVAIGAAFDSQDNVARNSSGDYVDYAYSTFDIHVDWPMGNNTISAEAGFTSLDFDDEVAMIVGTSTVNTKNSAGSGVYCNMGYMIGPNWQPFVVYDSWDSDSDNGTGSFDLLRVGVSYYLHGHNANIKLGYEQMNSDTVFLGNEDSASTFVLGFYVTY